MGPAEISTSTDPRSRRSWRITDPVIRLRERGTTDRIYGLPSPPVKCKIGSASELRLHDESGWLSRQHAELVPIVDGGWKIRDLRSKNGLRCDGELLPNFPLRPGVEITIGGLRLVAESLHLIGVLGVIRRFLGWAADRQADVDEALRSLRDWAAQRAELILVGRGDLTRITRRLHELLLGRQAAFIIHDDGDPVAAVRAAATGTLCVVLRRQADVAAIADHVHAADYVARPQLVVCAENAARAATIKRNLERPAVISLPSLASRSSEVERIAHESAVDIATELGAPGPGFSMHDLERLRAMPFNSIADIEETVRRILVDFGICKFHDIELARDIHTATKQYLGTPGYSAPEQILGKPVTAKTDIYALGVLAYRILCGRMPYVGDSNMAVMTQQCDPNASFPEPRALRRDIPREWNDLILLCLERDPARRPTAAELGRWIAAGMQNGASILASLAPQIAAETRASATAATISSDVPTALAQIQALSRRRGSRRAHTISLVAVAVAGVASAAVAFKLGGVLQTPAQPRAPSSSDTSHRTPDPGRPRPISQASPAPSGSSTSAPAGPQLAQGGAPRPANPTVRPGAEAQVSEARPRPSPGTTELARAGTGSALERSSQPAGPTSRTPPESGRAKRTTGTLEIRARTWADCFLIDDGHERSIGTAPTTVTDLATGRHRVRCKNDGQRKDETVTVTIDAAKTTVIEKHW